MFTLPLLQVLLIHLDLSMKGVQFGFGLKLKFEADMVKGLRQILKSKRQIVQLI